MLWCEAEYEPPSQNYMNVAPTYSYLFLTRMEETSAAVLMPRLTGTQAPELDTMKSPQGFGGEEKKSFPTWSVPCCWAGPTFVNLWHVSVYSPVNELLIFNYCFSPLCLKCEISEGTYTHWFCSCFKTQAYWQDIVKAVEKILRVVFQVRILMLVLVFWVYIRYFCVCCKEKNLSKLSKKQACKKNWHEMIKECFFFLNTWPLKIWP